MERPFIKGLDLSELFYREAVRPILDARYPKLGHSAARLGFGSDVLGFDTPQSTDHDWGPRFTLFLSEADKARHGDAIDGVLRQELPPEIHGFPTGFGHQDDGTTWMETKEGGPIAHQVRICTVRAFFMGYLNYDPAQEPGIVDWLTFPQQRLRTVASGRIFHDGLGELEPVRARLHYYPRDVWLYMLAAQWRRIAQEEAFVARCGDVGDDLGSRLIAARLIRELMRLCFLMERQYAPYSKWLGTAFARLACADELLSLFDRVLNAAHWQEREAHLSAAYEAAARMHNAPQIIEPLPTTVSRFHERPYLVPHADRYVDAIWAAIVDEQVRALPVHLGSVDQFADSTDVLDSLERLGQLRVLYG